MTIKALALQLRDDEILNATINLLRSTEQLFHAIQNGRFSFQDGPQVFNAKIDAVSPLSSQPLSGREIELNFNDNLIGSIR